MYEEKHMPKILDQIEDLMNHSNGFVTPLELNILRLFNKKSIKKMALEDGIEPHQVYSVFQRIRNRRRMWNKGRDLFNKLCRSRRFFEVLTPKAEFVETEGVDLE